MGNSGENYPSWDEAFTETYKSVGPENLIKINKEVLPNINKYFEKSLILTTFPFTKKEYKSMLQEFVNDRPYSYFFDQIINPNSSNIKNVFFKNDGHPNAFAHQIIARELHSYLRRMNRN